MFNKAMAIIRVELDIRAPRAAVFEKLQDHAAYHRFPPIDGSRLIREGMEHKNGTGAVRELRGGPIVFQEDITHYEPPARLDYLIRECNVPIVHKYGTIKLSESAPGLTHVIWESKFELPIPLIGALMHPFAVLGGSRAFREILEHIRGELETPQGNVITAAGQR